MNRNLVLLMFSLLVFLIYGNAFKEDIKILKEDLIFLNAKICKEKDILAKKTKLSEELKKQRTAALENARKFFSAKMNNSIILEKIQNFIKKISEDSQTELISSKWGEPLKQKGYIKLPISFSVKGYPLNIDKFLKELYSYDKIFKIERITITRTKKGKLAINFLLYVFKLEKKNET